MSAPQTELSFPETPVAFQSFTRVDPRRVGKGSVRVEGGAARADELAKPVRHEPAFRAFLTGFGAEEVRLNDAAKKLFAQAKSLPPAEFDSRLDREVIVGWKAIDAHIAALPDVTPRSRAVRDPLAQFIHLKPGALENLRDGIEQNSTQLMAASEAKFKQASTLPEEMKRNKQ